mmetsp:Transcript_26593/g.45396  ORF Transcript_26593/g.45396 Transcript_26593/m.45396 type:complete len:551 (-) Transcript_26593:64-1716(-)|eukprot:CAMPEP_0183781880 /NCGR_PEP_ID=MMETSP0739-20130205/59717_1 /TAXON_ID=385413 /ORGANISM="Thalassiosira miniscula, Strain CCMP1093" /LENGTH=550 /DNA_ID=CAMNT_0026025169 /DNA_START=148 /DNA_END=1800 /DNA_ORIENTATION=-
MTTKDDAPKKDTEQLIDKMKATKEKWDAEAAASPDGPDETDALLSQAISMAIEQGRGWSSPAEREKYLEQLLDDDFIPPLFAETSEELEKSGLKDAFTTLHNEGETPGKNMLEFRKKGNDSIALGRKNVAKNMGYYRDAVNHYYEAYHWASRIVPKDEDFVPTPEELAAADDDPYFTEKELDELRSIICSNCALAHMCLKNWGFQRDESKKAVDFNPNNLKAWYRLAKAHQMLQNWEEAGNAIDSGLEIEKDNKELLLLQKKLGEKVRKARLHRQQRERARAERTSRIKDVWRYCKEEDIALGRVSLVATVKDDEDEEEGGDTVEARWHHHYPHTGQLPKRQVQDGGRWTWPVLFVYPSHRQSDFIEHFGEDEIVALRMAQMFPEQEDDGSNETEMPWDYNNEFRCSNLAVYFEVHCLDTDKNSKQVIHPDCVERLNDQGAAMRFYESSRALKGDEGPEMATVARCMERKHLHHQRKAWIKKHGSLWAKPDPCPVVQVHPGVTLGQVLRSKKMVVPNFLVTIMLFPAEHPAHKEFLKTHKCIGIVEPEET